MKSAVIVGSLCALAVGCASTGGSVAHEGGSAASSASKSEPQKIRIYPRWATTARGSENFPGRNWEYFLEVGQTDEGETAIGVCSTMRFTGSRIPRDSCSRNNQIRMTLSAPRAFEQIVLFAVANGLEQGTLDLEDRPLFVDVTREYLEALQVQMFPVLGD